jgi:hypothetical protein
VPIGTGRDSVSSTASVSAQSPRGNATMHVESGTICGSWNGYCSERLGTDFLAIDAGTWNRLLDAAHLLIYTVRMISYTLCYDTQVGIQSTMNYY